MLERISETLSSLTHISVNQIWDWIGGTDSQWMSLSQSVVQLPTLLALSIRQLSTEHTLPTLLNQLNAPALRSLKCEFLDSLSVTSLISFVSRSGCSLQDLSILRFGEVPTESIPIFLRTLPALEDLALSLNKVAATRLSQVLSQHDFKTSIAPILPRLKRLSMKVYGLVHWPAIVGMYIEDPSSVCHPNDRKQTPILRPGRDSLQLLVRQQGPSDQACLIDIASLVAFAYLWQQHGVRIQVRQSQKSQENDLLVPSYCQTAYYEDGQPPDAILTSLKHLATLAL